MPDFFVGDPEAYASAAKRAFGDAVGSPGASRGALSGRADTARVEEGRASAVGAGAVLPSASDPPATLQGRTVFVTGGSRGIGLAIAKRAAADGANVVLAAKTVEPHPKLPGTIFTAAEECEAAGGKALPLQLNVQDEASIEKALARAKQEFGGVDILVNNASAIDNSATHGLAVKKFDLMHSINARGTFMASKHALPYLFESAAAGRNPHVLNLSPPLAYDPRWVKMGGTAYTMAKFNMSQCAVGMAAEYEGRVGFNCLWPCTAIATAAVDMLGGTLAMKASRTVDIMSDSAHWILTQDNARVTGNTFTDEDVCLGPLGMTEADLKRYRNSAWMPLMPDLYVGDAERLEWFLEKAQWVGSMAKGSFLSGKSRG
jgi:citronellol/citronellal dehydrogenase